MSRYPHVEWLDLYGDGTLHECAVVKRDGAGNTYFLRLRELDMVDKRRIFKVVTGRNANNFALWDLLYQTTLGNGMNALSYFHQYVRVKTPRGQIIAPSVGTIGSAATGVITPQVQPQQPMNTAQPVNATAEPVPAPSKAPAARRAAPTA